MLEVRHILCPVDFSEFSVRAYGYALSVARRYGAKLIAQHVVELWQYPYAGFAATAELYEEFSQKLRERAMEQLHEFVKKYTHGETRPEPEEVVQQGMAADSILAFAAAHETDLIAMGTHGRRGFDHMMLGSVTERVLRNAARPVLAVPRESRALTTSGQPEGQGPSRMLFCTDFSQNSERALSYALSLRADYDAELTLLHVLEDVPGAADVKKATVTAKEQLDKLVPSEGRKAGKIKTEVLTGEPYQQIIAFARKTKTDLVTMAVRGRGALDLAVFGSTTYRVLQLGPCPVLALHV